MVRVERGGEEVKISKRAGNYVTLRDLIDWTSRDAVRFFMLSRKADTEFTFDVDLALKQNDENPVFYVQYAHARICSVLEQYAAQGAGQGALVAALRRVLLEHRTDAGVRVLDVEDRVLVVLLERQVDVEGELGVGLAAQHEEAHRVAAGPVDQVAQRHVVAGALGDFHF